jgi:hypothetical protein
MSFPPIDADGRIVPQAFPQTVSQTVVVDSRDRNFDKYPSSSDFVVRLPQPIKNMTTAVLVNAELPLSYYVFSAARGTTTLTVIHDGTPATLTLRDGNYSATTMVAELKRLLDEAFSPIAFEVSIDASSMRCTLRPSSGTVQVDTTAVPTSMTFTARHGERTKVVGVSGVLTTSQIAATLEGELASAFAPATFQVSHAGGSSWSVVASEGSASLDVIDRSPRTEWGLGFYLGFARREVTPAAASVTGSRVATLNPENYLLIHVDELDGIFQSRMYEDGPGMKAFAKVPLNGDSYQYNYYDKTLTPVEMRPPVSSLDRLHVTIRFHDGSVVDLNGAEWSMSIEFEGTLARAP